MSASASAGEPTDEEKNRLFDSATAPGTREGPVTASRTIHGNGMDGVTAGVGEEMGVNEERSEADSVATAEAAEGDDEDSGPAFFAEADECAALLQRVTAAVPPKRDTVLPTAGEDPQGAVALLDQLAKILDRYQESPHLIHPHLESLMGPLVDLLVRYLPPAVEVWEWEAAMRTPKPDPQTASSSAGVHLGGENNAVPATTAIGEEGVGSSRLGQNYDLYDADAPKTALHVVCTALYTIVKTAGEKCCTSYFPNDVRYYEDVFYTLRLWKADPHRVREWQVRYSLLLWLSNLVLVPFALDIIDSAGPVREAVASMSSTHNDAATITTTSLSDAVLSTAVSFLSDTSKCREGAALLVAHLLTRPDSERHRRLFFTYAQHVLSTGGGGGGGANVMATAVDNETGLASDADRRDHFLLAQHGTVEVVYRPFLLPGVLLAIAKTMKLGQRHELVRYAAPLIPCVVALYESHGKDSLLCKTAVKVEQRLVLSMLRNTTASWKYQRHVASLAQNLAATTTVTTSGGGPAGNGHDTSATPTAADEAKHNKNEEEEGEDSEEDEDSDLDEANTKALEQGIELLLEAVGHKDTIVRWSAAKGIGRVCDRLPAGLANDVMEAVFALFQDSIGDTWWHGVLLAVAELCRRSNVSVAQLDTVVPLIVKGLSYELSKGTYTVGAHVRDAACYTCWSIARAYDAADLEPHVHRLSQALVVTALLDREVNVRRAAAAAFQECVGRLGSFPDGIALVTTMDFFSLSSLKHAYLRVAPQVAQYDAYRVRLLEELVSTKLVHWDQAVRQCASQAIGRIAPLEHALVLDEIVPTLLQQVTDATLSTRHGAVLGIAELVRALPPSCWSDAQRQQIIEVIARIDAERLFRSRGGEYLRQACCQLLMACADQRLPLPETITITKLSGEKGRARTLGTIQSFLEDSWKNILEWVQQCATQTFASVARTYYTSYQPGFHDKVLAKLLQGCTANRSPIERRGFLAAVGGLPACLLLAPVTPAPPASSSSSGEPFYVEVLAVLQKAALLSEADLNDPELADAEARRNAVQSLARVLVEVPPSDVHMTAARYEAVGQTLLTALTDYAVDKRGDVGSFVRLAVLQCLPSVLRYGLSALPQQQQASSPSSTTTTATCHTLCRPPFVLQSLQAVVKVAVEKLDRVRGVAGATLVSLLGSPASGESAEGLLPWLKVRVATSCSSSSATPALTLLEDVVHPADYEEVCLLASLVRHIDEDVQQRHMTWNMPQVTIAGLAQPLLCGAPRLFTTPVLEGITLAAGDLSAHVRAPAMDAVVAAFRGDEAAAASCASSESVAERQERLSASFVGVATTYTHCERVLVPLSRVLDALLNAAVFAPRHHMDLVNMLRIETRHYATTITVLLPLVSLLATLCRSPCVAARQAAWRLALTMIASRYPKVRAKMGTDLYTALLVLTSSASPSASSTPSAVESGAPQQTTEAEAETGGWLRAMDHLTRTQWDGNDAVKVRTARNALYDMLGIEPPSAKESGAASAAAAADGDGEMQPKKQTRGMVAATYQHLVNEAGY